MELYYVYDPMCSWCWGFTETWRQVRAALPSQVQPIPLLGGLAADDERPMDAAMAQQLQATWRRIEQRIPGIRFNFEFWERCTPRRSTYPACRAVIAAAALDPEQGRERMLTSIQQAYYRQARNTSERDTLVELAVQIGLDPQAFASRLDSAQTRRELQRQIARAVELGVSSYPALVLVTEQGARWPVAVDYTDPAAILATITMLAEA